MPETMQIAQVGITGFDHRIDLISETKFLVKQCTQIANYIIWGEAILYTKGRDLSLEPFVPNE